MFDTADDGSPSPNFLHGAAMVIAIISRDDNLAACARRVMDRIGLTISDFEAAGIDDADLDELRRVAEA